VRLVASSSFKTRARRFFRFASTRLRPAAETKLLPAAPSPMRIPCPFADSVTLPSAVAIQRFGWPSPARWNPARPLPSAS
jgi:hypothetical protein